MEFNIFANQEGSLMYISAENQNEVLINFCIRNMPEAQILSTKGGSSISIRKDDLNLIVFKHENSIVVQFTNKSAKPEGYTMQFENPINTLQNNTFSLQSSNHVFLLCERSTCIANDNELNIYPSGNHSIITLYFPQDANETLAFSSLSSPQAMSEGVYIVSNNIIPEFSIGVYDDSARIAPRPARLGVPVISTIPVNRVGLSESELQIMEIGLGPSSRTMYFKIISNVVIPNTVTPVLHIYMPAGLDTINEPVTVEMIPQVSSDSNRSVFHASYAFNKEDTVNYVDGFAYLSVYMPMEITANLSIAMGVTATGSPVADTYQDDPTLG